MAFSSYTFTQEGHKYDFSMDWKTLDLISISVDDSPGVVEYLSHGTFGSARLVRIEGANPCKFVAKLPVAEKCLATSPDKDQHLQNEYQILKELYPNDGMHAFFSFSKEGDGQANKTKYAYLHVMPYFPGMGLNRLFMSATSRSTLLSMFHAFFTSLNALHQNNIFHGDLHSSNVRTRLNPDTQRYEFRFIDFYFGYRRQDKQAVSVKNYKISHVAPERRGRKTALPHESQDIFSCGKLLEQAYEFISMIWIKDSAFPVPLTQYFPACLQEFTLKSLSVAPEKRPSLSSVIEKLEIELKESEISNELSYQPGSDGGQFILRANGVMVPPSFVYQSPNSIHLYVVNNQNIRVKLSRAAGVSEFRENYFLMKMYPEYESSLWGKFSIRHHPDKPVIKRNDVCSVSPFFLGRNFLAWMEGPVTEIQMLTVIIKILEEVQRMHDLGIVHANLKDISFVIDDSNKEAIRVFIINFTNACYIHEESIKCHDERVIHWAPERIKTEWGVKPAYHHDIYSLAHLFRSKNLKDRIKTKQPLIERLINWSMCGGGIYRTQTLKHFIRAFKNELLEEKSIPAVVNQKIVKNTKVTPAELFHYFQEGIDQQNSELMLVDGEPSLDNLIYEHPDVNLDALLGFATDVANIGYVWASYLRHRLIFMGAKNSIKYCLKRGSLALELHSIIKEQKDFESMTESTLLRMPTIDKSAAERDHYMTQCLMMLMNKNKYALAIKMIAKMTIMELDQTVFSSYPAKFLHEAVKKKSDDLVKALVDAGADFKAVFEGYSPIELAAKQSDGSIVDILMEKYIEKGVEATGDLERLGFSSRLAFFKSQSKPSLDVVPKATDATEAIEEAEVKSTVTPTLR